MIFLIKKEKKHIVFQLLGLKIKIKENKLLRNINIKYWTYIINNTDDINKAFELIHGNISRKNLFKIFQDKYGLEKATDIFVKDYIEKVPSLVNEELKELRKEDIDVPSDCTWAMWLQEDPPELVQACINSIKKIYPNLVVITEKNINNYIEIPDFILKRLKSKQMTKTNFSDWVRSVLLDKYGGIWFDATLLLTQKLPDEMTKESFNLLRAVNGGISSWLIVSNKNNYLIKSMRVYMEEYWKNENFIFNYFMFHKFFTRYVKQNETAKIIYQKTKFFDSKPAFMLCNQSFKNGYGHLSEDYDEEYYNQVKNTYFVQKLTYKDKNAKNNPNSYYWHIVNEYTNK